MLKWLWRLAVAGGLLYAGLFALVALRATQLLNSATIEPVDAAMVLGSRAYVNGAPNPCLTGRVDKAMELVATGAAQRLLLTGGVDLEDGRVEADVMAEHARSNGYAGDALLERASVSTRENLSLSWPLLQHNGVQSLVVVSEPYHMWRVERLVRANPDYANLRVTYAAAPTYCWQQWGMSFKGALREPLAIVGNALKGYF
ncbi:MAG: YdcF family protein [Formosimonas sp.]